MAFEDNSEDDIVVAEPTMAFKNFVEQKRKEDEERKQQLAEEKKRIEAEKKKRLEAEKKKKEEEAKRKKEEEAELKKRLDEEKKQREEKARLDRKMRDKHKRDQMDIEKMLGKVNDGIAAGGVIPKEVVKYVKKDVVEDKSMDDIKSLMGVSSNFAKKPPTK